jgi:3-deoxy-D-manno-octulosonic-acid transferase
MMSGAGASREIASPTELGEAVEGLLNPDRAAAMAHAAWAVCSTGAEATNRVVDLIRRHLDRVH